MLFLRVDRDGDDLGFRAVANRLFGSVCFDKLYEINSRAPHGLVEQENRFDSLSEFVSAPLAEIFAFVNSGEANGSLIDGHEEISAPLKTASPAICAGGEIFINRTKTDESVLFFVAARREVYDRRLAQNCVIRPAFMKMANDYIIERSRLWRNEAVV